MFAAWDGCCTWRDTPESGLTHPGCDHVSVSLGVSVSNCGAFWEPSAGAAAAMAMRQIQVKHQVQGRRGRAGVEGCVLWRACVGAGRETAED